MAVMDQHYFFSTAWLSNDKIMGGQMKCVHDKKKVQKRKNVKLAEHV
jgi:hypothetical protein